MKTRQSLKRVCGKSRDIGKNKVKKPVEVFLKKLKEGDNKLAGVKIMRKNRLNDRLKTKTFKDKEPEGTQAEKSQNRVQVKSKISATKEKVASGSSRLNAATSFQNKTGSIPLGNTKGLRSLGTDLIGKKQLELKVKKKIETITSQSQVMQSPESSEEKENVSLDVFYQLIKSQCELSERWVLNSPRYDKHLQQYVILVIELDITNEGDMRSKRCVKILEDKSFKVLLYNVDMTHLFDLNKKMTTTNEIVQLLYCVQLKKMCQGVKNFAQDYSSLVPRVNNYQLVLRGSHWYSVDCAIVVQKVFMGNSCTMCSKIKNQIKRRFNPETRRRIQPKTPAKQTKIGFGKAVYTTLNEFIGKSVIPSSHSVRENLVFDEKLEIYLNEELSKRIDAAASMPPPPPPPPKVPQRPAVSRKRPKSTANRASRFPPPSATITSASAHTMQGIQEFITEDGQICYVTNVISDPSQNMGDSMVGLAGLAEQFQWGQMVVEKYEPPEMEEMVTLGEHGDIIIQNIKGEAFTLAEGQEYELIGEAQPSMDSMELMSADNQQIQIIEVDDETLAQIQVHEGVDNMQIAHVDPNDPNFRQLLRAFQNQDLQLGTYMFL